MAITDVEFQEWSHNPVTQAFANTLRNSRQSTMVAWSQEAFRSDVENAAALGGIRVLNELISDIEDEMKGYAE
jgi:hypothetical protein